MQFTFITTVLVACMTIFVSASPIPLPVQVEARAQPFLPREPTVEVAHEADVNPELTCARFQCF